MRKIRWDLELRALGVTSSSDRKELIGMAENISRVTPRSLEDAWLIVRDEVVAGRSMKEIWAWFDAVIGCGLVPRRERPSE